MLATETILVTVSVSICGGSTQSLASSEKTIEEWAQELKSEDVNRRIAAARTLGTLGVKAAEAIPVLSELLHDDVWQVRLSSARTLGNFGPLSAEAIPALTALLADENPWVRNCAAEALGKMKADSELAVGVLLRLLDDDDGLVQCAAAEALGRLGIAAVPTLPQIISDRRFVVQLTAAQSLSQSDSSDDKATAVAIFAELLEQDEPSGFGRMTIVRQLGQMGSDARAAIPALTAVLEQKKSIRITAETFGRIGPEGIAAAMPILARLANDKEYLVRSHAAQALSKLEQCERNGRNGAEREKDNLVAPKG